MFASIWAQAAEGGGHGADFDPSALLLWLCLMAPVLAVLAVLIFNSVKGNRRGQAFIQESREREERMIELLESLERELRQLNARQAGAGKEPPRPPADKAIRPPAQP